MTGKAAQPAGRHGKLGEYQGKTSPKSVKSGKTIAGL